MQYTSYYREDATLTYEEYKDMTFQILTEYPNYQWESMRVRKLTFIGNYDMNACNHITFVICMKNKDENQLYLEKKIKQNGRYLKSCAKLTKEEVLKILSDDMEWMKDHKNPLFSDFYLQKTVNQITPVSITDYLREVIQVGKKGVIIFNKEVLRDGFSQNDFFESLRCPIPCVGMQEVHYVYKQKASIPVVLSHMLQQQEEGFDQVAMSL